MYKNFTKQRKWRFLMRLSFAYIFLLIGGIQLLSASNSKGQGLEDIMVTIEVKEGNLESLFKRIEHQTQLTFAYLPADIQKYNHITLKPGKQSVKFALDQALRSTALSYRSIENSVIIFPKPTPNNTNKHSEHNKSKNSLNETGSVLPKEKKIDKKVDILESFMPVNPKLVCGLEKQMIFGPGENLLAQEEYGWTVK